MDNIITLTHYNLYIILIIIYKIYLYKRRITYLLILYFLQENNKNTPLKIRKIKWSRFSENGHF